MRLSNLPPGVTDRDIEEQAGAYDDDLIARLEGWMRAERAEAERDALRTENERLRTLLRDWRGTCACHNDDIGSLIDDELRNGA